MTTFAVPIRDLTHLRRKLREIIGQRRSEMAWRHTFYGNATNAELMNEVDRALLSKEIAAYRSQMKAAREQHSRQSARMGRD